MLSFISYWRAAAVVLCDLASSAYYACGIAEASIGKAAPWFILAIMLFSLPLRWVYMESCAMFVRGGVYKTVKAAIGGPLAKFAVSAIMFDYILTGPISAVAAAQYLTKFVNETTIHFGYGYIQLPPIAVVVIAALIILYFWRNNVIGVHESSTKSLRIVQLTTVMVIVLVGWSILTLVLHPQPLPPFHPELHEEVLGWLKGFSWVRTVPSIGIAIALGHSLLAMSGEEALSQVYREIAAPKMKNMKRAVGIIFIYSFVLTGIVSLFAVMLIPDNVRGSYNENLLSGLAMYLVGPMGARLALQGFVVLVGVLLLAGACNTAFVGANGTLGRIAEDGILPQWLRHPHPRYGTTHRMLHQFGLVQILIVFASRGDVNTLGEAYAFGVVWSFFFQTLAMLVLRFKDRSPREYRVPLNIPIGRTDFPLGIFLACLFLFIVAIANFFTKTIATQCGLAFTTASFLALTISEKYYQRNISSRTTHLERVNLAFTANATPESCGLIHPHRVLCAVRDPNNLVHLRRIAEKIDATTTDLIVLSIQHSALTQDSTVDQLPLDERQLITNVVAVAERFGVHVVPLIVPADDPIYAIVKAAYDLGAAEIIVGRSGKTRPEIQLEKLAMAWGYISAAHPRHLRIRVIWPQQEIKFDLG